MGALATICQVATAHIEVGRQIEGPLYAAWDAAAADVQAADDDYRNARLAQLAEIAHARAVIPPRPAITAEVIPDPPEWNTGDDYPAAVVTAAPVAARLTDADRVERYGRCQFRAGHKVSVRVFGNQAPPAARTVIGNNTGTPGYESDDSPAVNICHAQKCLDLASAWLTEQGWPDCTYRELL
jgi:hypothetical protein